MIKLIPNKNKSRFRREHIRVLSDFSPDSLREDSITEIQKDYNIKAELIRDEYADGQVVAANDNTIGFVRGFKVRVKGRLLLDELRHKEYEESWRAAIQRLFISTIGFVLGVAYSVIAHRITE